jgi:hypothetical protein
MDKMWWAVLNDSDDILHYVEAETEEEATSTRSFPTSPAWDGTGQRGPLRT